MFKIRIKDIEWTVKLQNDEEYFNMHEDDSLALTNRNELVVYFRESAVVKRIVTHELMHVYVASCCVGSTTNTTIDDAEEICAEIIEYHIDDIIKHTREIYAKLVKLKNIRSNKSLRTKKTKSLRTKKTKAQKKPKK